MKQRPRARTERRKAARNAPPQRRHLAGSATYPGDLASVVGEVKGPTTFGSLLVAVQADHDRDAGRTRVTFATLTDRDYELVAKTREPHIPFPIVVDEDGRTVKAASW